MEVATAELQRRDESFIKARRRHQGNAGRLAVSRDVRLLGLRLGRVGRVLSEPRLMQVIQRRWCFFWGFFFRRYTLLDVKFSSCV